MTSTCRDCRKPIFTQDAKNTSCQLCTATVMIRLQQWLEREQAKSRLLVDLLRARFALHRVARWMKPEWQDISSGLSDYGEDIERLCEVLKKGTSLLKKQKKPEEATKTLTVPGIGPVELPVEKRLDDTAEVIKWEKAADAAEVGNG